MHSIEFFDFEEGKVSEKEIQDRMNAYSVKHSDNSCVLPNDISFLKAVFNTRKDAEEYLDKMAEGRFYPELAVQYRDISGMKMGKEKEKLLRKLDEARGALCDLERRQHYCKDTTNAKLISCRKCESRLAVAYLRGNRCPVCNTDLRPESVIARRDALRQKLDDLSKEILELDRATVQKAKEGIKVKWLVRIDYHC